MSRRKRKRHLRNKNKNRKYKSWEPNQELKVLEAKSKNQEIYIDAIYNSDITFCSGPAGSGKTAIAVGVASEYILDEEIEKLVITRPVVESGKGLGHLPGTLVDKIKPYLVPLIEEMHLYIGKDKVRDMRYQNLIELCPLEYMRGRNFHDTFMVLDEAQNATFEQIKMFLTRIGQGSKAVINGDISQTDLPAECSGGLITCVEKLADIDGVSICNLGDEDIVRNTIIGEILTQLKGS